MKISNDTKLNHKVRFTSQTSGTREHFVSDIVKNNNLKLGPDNVWLARKDKKYSGLQENK